MGITASMPSKSTSDARVLKQLTTISETHLAEIVRLIVTAFGENDPPLNGLLGGDMTFRDELFTAMVRATLLEGKVYVVESNSQLVSVALWFHKPNTLFGSDDQRALGYDDLYKKLPGPLQHWWSVDYPKQMHEYQYTFISEEEWKKMQYCHLMVTDPRLQNKGHASFLMDKLATEAREAGEILGLSTGVEANVAKYTVMGYRERGRIVVRTLVNEIPCVWMTKE